MASYLERQDWSELSLADQVGRNETLFRQMEGRIAGLEARIATLEVRNEATKRFLEIVGGKLKMPGAFVEKTLERIVQTIADEAHHYPDKKNR